MIVATILNIISGKKNKAVGPLEVMGYDDDEPGGKPAGVQTQQETALRMRLMMAGRGRAKKGK